MVSRIESFSRQNMLTNQDSSNSSKKYSKPKKEFISDVIDDKSKIRSSTGLAVDWLTPIGPLTLSFAKPITKSDTDKTETFRFDIGTTF